MLLVVDANVLVGELLRDRGRHLFEGDILHLRISETALDEMSRRAARIVEQGRVSRPAMDAMLDEARGIVESRISTVPSEVSAGFEVQAAYRVPRDPDDAPIIHTQGDGRLQLPAHKQAVLRRDVVSDLEKRVVSSRTELFQQ